MYPLKNFFVAGALFCAVLPNSACTYYMLYKASNYDYDDNRADRDIEEIEQERTKRLVSSGYSDEEIEVINRNNSRSTHTLSIEELRQQQEKEREARKKKGK
ncbi:MAG: hypothetical protein K6B46_03165 [Opitutales bacterium]|nr:hypothetical protein [Opitutales bacterium]